MSVMKISWTISHSLSAAESETLPGLLRKSTIFERPFVDLTVLLKTYCGKKIFFFILYIYCICIITGRKTTVSPASSKQPEGGLKISVVM